MNIDITVEPAEFTHVDFEAGVISALVQRLANDIGLEGPIRIVVDETTPLGFSELTSVDPITIELESGAIENPKKLREFSPDLTADVIGRHLLRAHDRLSSDFGDVPADPDLTLRQVTAWDTYTVGRLVRMGHAAQRQRRLYQFRNRHGFTDAADAAFEQLWNGEDLTWAEIDHISSEAEAANPGRLSA